MVDVVPWVDRNKSIDVSRYIEKAEVRLFSNGYMVKFYPVSDIDPGDYRLHFTMSTPRVSVSSYRLHKSYYPQPIELMKWWGGEILGLSSRSQAFDAEVTLYTAATGEELGTGEMICTVVSRTS